MKIFQALKQNKEILELKIFIKNGFYNAQILPSHKNVKEILGNNLTKPRSSFEDS